MKWSIFQDYYSLCKPKVIFLMLVTCWVGMILATQNTLPWNAFIFGTLGIALSGAAAAVINHLVDRRIDAKMTRTLYRPIASGRITPKKALMFASILAISGISILFFWVNPLTAYLSVLTVLGYACFYTLFLKRATPQNIVIGGAAGATPPLLGWVAVSNEMHAFAWLLVLIIFTWTPPHFWALAIYRQQEYAAANIPMLPVTHGLFFTKLCIVLYTCLLWAVTLLPYVVGMSGLLYFIFAFILGAVFLGYALILFRSKSPSFALKTFSFSILYLLLLFIFLLMDYFLSRIDKFL
jgi:protoheme IX farnesyltransferase